MSRSTLRFLSWNVASRGNTVTIERQGEYMTSLAPDVVALQEVSRKQAEAFASLLSWAHNSFEVADERPGWPTAKHELGCLIAGSTRVRLVAPAELLPSLYDGPVPRARANTDDEGLLASG